MKFKYFKIGEAFNEAKDSLSLGNNSEKLVSSAKLLGKSLANIGIFAAEAGIEGIKRLPETIGEKAKEKLKKESHLMTDEDIEKAQKTAEMGEVFKERRLEKEREERRLEKEREERRLEKEREEQLK